jgi:Hypothetical protein (DUF2513)
MSAADGSRLHLSRRCLTNDKKMKRDLDLIRQMMFALERNAELNGRFSYRGTAETFFPEITDRSPDDLAYNLMRIIDAGWVEGEYNRTGGDFILWGLTNEGHDFIESTRKPDIWEQMKQAFTEGFGAGLRAVGDVAKKLAQKEIEKRLGLD